MVRLSNLTEEELLEKEEDWLEREDESDPAWINEGVRIYRELSRANPREIRYRETLSYLLLLQGEDLKLRKGSYESAIRSFVHLIRIDPSNARAHYRLGFLYFYQSEWAKSIDSFHKSLHSLPRNSRNQLQKDQQIKARYYIIKTTQIILNESLEEAKQIPTKDLELFGEMKLLLKEMQAIGQAEDKPYQMIVNGVEFASISEREYEHLSDPFENKEWIILNFISMNDVILSLNGKEINITSTLAPLLEYLMRNPEGVSRHEILQRRYYYSKNPSAALRQHISRLRSCLRGIDSNQTWIENINGLYRWNSSYNHSILKHSRDVSTDLLLD